ncbi:MAG: MarR family winged helix-turn-helix transcriptional regulator [Planctomycetaceae bacterium]
MSPTQPVWEMGSSGQESSPEILRFEDSNPSVDQACLEDSRSQTSATELIDTILRTAHLLRGVLADHFAEFGLSNVRYSVMKMVEADNTGGCSQAKLAGHLKQSESSISTLVDRMRSDALLYRLPSQTDRRKKVLMLTEKGRGLLRAIDGCHETRMRELLQDIDAEQLETQVGQLATRLAEFSSTGSCHRSTVNDRRDAWPQHSDERDQLRRSA